MVWEFQCPRQGCDYTETRNREDDLVEAAQQHVRDAHGDTPTRDEVEEYLVGPG